MGVAEAERDEEAARREVLRMMAPAKSHKRRTERLEGVRGDGTLRRGLVRQAHCPPERGAPEVEAELEHARLSPSKAATSDVLAAVAKEDRPVLKPRRVGLIDLAREPRANHRVVERALGDEPRDSRVAPEAAGELEVVDGEPAKAEARRFGRERAGHRAAKRSRFGP